MTGRGWFFVRTSALGALLAGVAVYALVRTSPPDASAEERASPDATARMEAKKNALYAEGRYDEEGYRRMGTPKMGDWLFRFEESGQTEPDYERACANKRAKGRETIYVTEVGKLSPRALAIQDAVRDFVSAYFQLPVVRRDPEDIPTGAFSKARQQVRADSVLDALAGERPADALVSVGLLDTDLYTDSLPNFVFGLGSLDRRVGAYSFVRLANGTLTPDKVYLTRALRIVVHEMGHILSLPHCIYYECVMNGQNSLVESDRTPIHPCPVCLAKLRWNLGFDDLAREKAIAASLERLGLAEELAWTRARIARLEAAAKVR